MNHNPTAHDVMHVLDMPLPFTSTRPITDDPS
jgi:hypothetical protein